MDAHIGSSFSGMREIFLNSNNLSSDQAGLMGIGAKLQIEINKLIQGCTLQGEGHNQLHAYLTKYIPAVATLSTSGRMKDAQMVGHYLKIYNEYFE
jgi:hypothetical protein